MTPDKYEKQKKLLFFIWQCLKNAEHTLEPKPLETSIDPCRTNALLDVKYALKYHQELCEEIKACAHTSHT